MPTSIPNDLNTPLREVPGRCGPFESDAALRNVFAVDSLAPWRDGVPEADSRAGRVNALVSYILEKCTTQGDAVLLLFLHELTNRCDSATACHRDLRAVADALAAAWGESTSAVSIRPPGERATLPLAPGSPFVVGRPLRASEPIFGREAAFDFIRDALARFSSVNIVGERRMGKTSLLHHLTGQPKRYLRPQPDQPPPVSDQSR